MRTRRSFQLAAFFGLLISWTAIVPVARGTRLFDSSVLRLGVGDGQSNTNLGSFGAETLDPVNGNNKTLVFSSASDGGSTGGVAIKIDTDTPLVMRDLTPSTPTTPLTSALGAETVWGGLSAGSDNLEFTVRYELVDIGSGKQDTVKATFSVFQPISVTRQGDTHSISIKFGIDTQIGSNDGAPIALPSGIFTHEAGFGNGFADPVPDFWQALENPDLSSPGLVAQGTLFGAGATRPDRFILGSYGNHISDPNYFENTPSETTYDDSAVALWWLNREIQPGQTLTFVTFYGLSDYTASSSGGVTLSLTAPATAPIDGNGAAAPFSVQALIQNNTGSEIQGAPVTVDFPDGGLQLAAGSNPAQQIMILPNGQQLVSWTLIPDGTNANPRIHVTVDIGEGAGPQTERSITVPPELLNQPPVAEADTLSIRNNVQDVLLNVLANDHDPEGESLTLTQVTSGSAGGTTGIEQNQVRYTPPTGGFNGLDTFGYQIEDEFGNTGSGTVAVRVFPAPEVKLLSPVNGETVRPDIVLQVGVNVAPVAFRRIDSGGNAFVGRTGDGTGPDYAFYLGATPITVEQFLPFLNELAQYPNFYSVTIDTTGRVYGINSDKTRHLLFDPAQTKESVNHSRSGFDYGIQYTANHTPAYSHGTIYGPFPVVGVTWYGAVAYCNWLTLAKGENHVAYTMMDAAWRPSVLTSQANWLDGFDGTERADWLAAVPTAYRLPMDGESNGANEWNEYLWGALAGGDPQDNPYGTTDGGNYWNSGDYFDNAPSPAGYYPPNIFGLEDMSGNAWQWQTDLFFSGGRTATNLRAIRGGSWYTHQTPATFRGGADADSAFSDVGFRIATQTPDFTFQIEASTDSSFNDQTATVYRNYDPADSMDFGMLERTWAPGDLAPATTYYWRARAYDGLTATWTDWKNQVFTTSDQTRMTTPLQLNLGPKWALISMDRDPEIWHPQRLFGMHATTWGWNAARQVYEKPFALETFKGYWVYLDEAEPRNVAVSGFTPLQNETTLRGGWNLIGPAAADSPIPENNRIRGPIYGWNTQNQHYTTLTPIHESHWQAGSGYWIFAVPGFTLELPGDE